MSDAAAHPHLWVSPTIDGLAFVGTEPMPGRTEYVRADQMVELLREVSAFMEPGCPRGIETLAKVNTFITTQGADHAQV